MRYSTTWLDNGLCLDRSSQCTRRTVRLLRCFCLFCFIVRVALLRPCLGLLSSCSSRFVFYFMVNECALVRRADRLVAHRQGAEPRDGLSGTVHRGGGLGFVIFLHDSGSSSSKAVAVAEKVDDDDHYCCNSPTVLIRLMALPAVRPGCPSWA